MKNPENRKANARHSTAVYYALLTAAVTVTFLSVHAYLILTGREAVWTQDAQPLYANFLVWASQVMEQWAEALTQGKPIELPLYTYSMGYGADVPMTMGSYLQDPVNIIPLALPNELIGISYPAMTWLRMVLAAAAFSWYCLSRGHGKMTAGIASIAYVTCGFTLLLCAFRHPKFMDWAILLPLILQGADRLFAGKRPVMLCLSLLAQFFVSIYFSYMSCLVLFIYCLIKYFALPRDRSLRDFSCLVLSFLATGVVAFLISGLFSLPQIVALLSQGRATSAKVVPLLFSIKYYSKIAAHFIGAAASTEGMTIGAASTLGLLVFAFGKRHFDQARWRAWGIALICCFAGILFPFFGHVMNGMGYSTDRWMLVFAFVGSYILCMGLPVLKQLNDGEWSKITVGACVIAALAVGYGGAQVFLEDGWKGCIWPITVAMLFMAIVLLTRKLFARPEKSSGIGIKYNSARFGYYFLGLSVIVGAALSCFFYCAPLGQNWGDTFPKNGTTWKNISERTPAAAVDQIDDDSVYRYTLARVHNSMKNSALAHGSMGIDYYTSYYNQNVDDFRQELGISDHHMNFSFIGSDSRLALENLAGAKYYICQDRDIWRVPYGFVNTGMEYNKFHVFENTTTMPLAFLADKAIERSAYEALSMTEKQEALLQGAVIDDAKLSERIPTANTTTSSRSLEYSFGATDGVTIDGKSFQVSKKDATVELVFDGLPDSETYVTLTGLDFSSYKPSQLKQVQGKAVSATDSIRDLLYTAPTTYPITAIAGERTNRIVPATPQHLRYGGKVDWVLNLCYSDKVLNSIVLKFDEPGEYTFHSLEVVCQPVQPIVSNARKIAASGLDDIELDTNRMTASAMLPDERARIAVFTFANTSGWTVNVDGEPAEVLNVDTAFLGVELSGKGTHVIEWSYTTPGLKAGCALSIIGIAIGIASLLFMRILNRRKFAING